MPSMKTKTGITVRDAMTKRPVTASPDETIQECAKRMSRQEVGSLVIEKKGTLLGIVSEKDIVERVVAQGKNPAEVKASEVMSKNLVTITPDKDIYDAILLMSNEEIRKLPVVDGKKLVGYLTTKDVIKIEPALFDIFYGRIEELREEGKKPLKYEYGTCEKCGSQGPVQKIKMGLYLCGSCLTK